jgi:glycogen synthase
MSKNNKKPKLLIATPEIILGLPEGSGNLLRKGINFSNGGMAPVGSNYIRGLVDNSDFETYAVVPKWESSLREFNDLSTLNIKKMTSYLQDNLLTITHPSFNKVPIKGTNTLMYDKTSRFNEKDRAIAFSAGVVNYVIPEIRPDIIWVNDWMLGPVAVAAKAQDIAVVTTGHNIFTHCNDLNEIINSIDLRPFDDYRPDNWLYSTNSQFDFMASAINSADDFTTVSPSFLKRILNDEFYGYPNMSPSVIDAIKTKAEHNHPDGRSRVHGYLNPLEEDKSCLLDDIENVGLNETIKKRKKNAEKLRNKTGLKEGGKIVIFPNRLYDGQKNPRLIIDNAKNLAYKYDLRILFVANGDKEIVEYATNIALGSDGYVSYQPFDRNLENLAKVSDNTYGLMTSTYEPCGGPNLNYPLGGTLVIGHAVDGIKDTVIPLDIENGKGNGFPYFSNDLDGLESAIIKMCDFASKTDEIKYSEYTRIAKETLKNHSAKARIKQVAEEIFLPLLYEKGLR